MQIIQSQNININALLLALMYNDRAIAKREYIRRTLSNLD